MTNQNSKLSETDTKTQGPKPRTSRLAIWSLVLAIGGSLIGVALLATLLLTPWLIYWIVIISPAIIFSFVGAWILSLIMGIAALAKIKESSGILKGRGFAIAGVVTSGVGLTLACLCIMRARRIHTISPRVICGTNLRGLGKALQIYANDYDDQYPTAEKWCDLLIAYIDVGPKQFVCKGSDAKIGESSHAFNKNLIGKRPTEVSPDVVVLFETDFGKNPAGRQELFGNREWYKELSSRGDKWDLEWIKKYRPSEKVYKQRWNQFGGPEILTTENHKGKGCNILFNNGRVEFVKPEQLGELRWEVEESEK